MAAYQTPSVEELGTVAELTEGRHFSRVDGTSGTTGNRGDGRGGVDKP